MAFPYRTPLLIEVSATLGLVGGRHNVLICSGAAPTPTMHDTYQVYAFGGNEDDYSGTSEY